MSGRLQTRAIHGVTGLIEDGICPFCLLKTLDQEHKCQRCLVSMDKHFDAAVEVYSSNLEAIIARAETKGLEIPHTLLPTRAEAYREMLGILRTILFSGWPSACPVDWCEKLQSAVRNAERAMHGPEDWIKMEYSTPDKIRYRLRTPKGSITLQVNPQTNQLDLFWNDAGLARKIESEAEGKK